MSKKQQKAIARTKAVKPNQKHTPEALREALQEFDIEVSASQQAKAIGAIYRVATREPEVKLTTLLSAVGKLQNLHSLSMRAAALLNKKGINSQFFLSA